jgi:hypothetical protein
MGDDWGAKKGSGGYGTLTSDDPWDLWPEAAQHLTEVGLALDPDAERELRQLLHDASRELNGSSSSESAMAGWALELVDDRRPEAVNNLRTLVSALAEESAARGEPTASIDTLRTVLKKLCPIFPFCKD